MLTLGAWGIPIPGARGHLPREHEVYLRWESEKYLPREREEYLPREREEYQSQECEEHLSQEREGQDRERGRVEHGVLECEHEKDIFNVDILLIS